MNYRFKILTFVLLFCSALLSATEPVVIGQSNSKSATAFNNGRRIARNLNDRRIVVFQDSTALKHTIMWTWSDDGDNWSTPQILGEGKNPSITIDSGGTFYTVWTPLNNNIVCGKYLEPNSLQWQQKPQHPKLTTHSFFPSIQVTESGVWIAWHEPVDYKSDVIKLVRYTQYFESKDQTTLRFADPDWNARFVSVTCDLEFEPGLLHLAWTEFNIADNTSRIKYITFDENNFTSYEQLQSTEQIVSNSSGKVFPSLSIRNYSKNSNKSSEFVIACSDTSKNYLYTMMSTSSPRKLLTNICDSLKCSGYTLASVDDILRYLLSCAITWQDDEHIYYNQFQDENFSSLEPYQVNKSNGSHIFNPSVCYKTFRPKLFDIVWTEGNEPPFRIMYRRMPKKYPGLPDSVKITTNYLPKGIYKNVYVGRLYATHVWDYKEHWELIDGNLPDNLFVSIGAGGGMVVGTPIESGTYNFTLALSIIIARDTWISADTMDYCLVIENNPPQFVSTDSVSASVGANLSYIAEAIDPDENVLSYNFINKPYWLSPQDSLLSGTVPVNACDTSFTVLTTDGELTDSLKVKIHITQQNSALPEKQNNIPHTFYLQQNFPNPFNAETKIKFALSRQDLTNISIYNLSGKKIAELIQQHLPPGLYSVIWNAKNQPSGIYFIKLTSGSFQAVKKCILVK